MAGADGRGDVGDSVQRAQVFFHARHALFGFADVGAFAELAFHDELGTGGGRKEHVVDETETDDGQQEQTDHHGDGDPAEADGDDEQAR